jgi:hypothetical protein
MYQLAKKEWFFGSQVLNFDKKHFEKSDKKISMYISTFYVLTKSFNEKPTFFFVVC